MARNQLKIKQGPVRMLGKKIEPNKHLFKRDEHSKGIHTEQRDIISIIPEKSSTQDLLSRIKLAKPYPILAHHFGRPNIQETITGIKEIALSGVLDVISISPDQNAQEYFFRPDKLEPGQQCDDGVPLRSSRDMEAIYEASRRGNFPLVRCYAGTQDLLKWAAMSVKTIYNAWAAIPLCWYSELDGRSSRTLEEAIIENQNAMRWYALQNIPVEVNESNHWSLREAHDSLTVSMAFLAAYNAKRMGVQDYIAQFMFNTPNGTTAVMDIAKMLAELELISELEDENFTIYRKVRAGTVNFSGSPSIAKGQLASSTLISLILKPDIINVAEIDAWDLGILPGELVENCRIVRGVLQACLQGLPDMLSDTTIINRKDTLVYEARTLLECFKFLGADSDDPMTDPNVIASAIREGFLDIPNFKGYPDLKGEINTKMINGAWYAIDASTDAPIDEETRMMTIFKRIKKQ